MSSVEPHQADAPFVLSLDIGTSSVRALLFDGVGRSVEGATARRTYELRTTTEGAAEADPDAMLHRIWSCIDEVLERAGDLSERIAAVAACTFVSNLLGMDEKGQAVTPSRQAD
jgi:gluconokinase